MTTYDELLELEGPTADELAAIDADPVSLDWDE
jgi:hypothetical protein